MNQVGHAAGLQLGIFLQRGVEVVDVGGVVLAMVDLHGLGVDVRLQRFERVRQGGQDVFHGCSPSESRTSAGKRI